MSIVPAICTVLLAVIVLCSVVELLINIAKYFKDNSSKKNNSNNRR